MSGNGQNHEVPEAPDVGAAAEDAADDDDEFGEFEGFEGGMERMQAQPTPSPWATFPDLLPVQTSPATPAEDSQASSSRNQNVSRDCWQAAAPAALWIPGSSHEPSRSLPQQMRTLNPPDVSLGTNQAVGGRITPDNVHDAALAVVMDHMDGGASDARLSVAQIDALNQQLENAEHNRALLEEQVDGLRQRNVELEQLVANSQAQIDELNSRLVHNQEVLEQRLSDLRHLFNADWQNDSRLIQQEIESMKQSQLVERKELEASRQSLQEIKTGIYEKLQKLESNIQKDYVAMEERLSKQIDEQCQQIKAAVENIVHQTTRQISGSFSQLLSDAIQNTSSGDHQSNNLLQSIKVELEKHTEQQKQILEEERQRQLVTVSSALQTALQHLNSAIKKDSKSGDIS